MVMPVNPNQAEWIEPCDCARAPWQLSVARSFGPFGLMKSLVAVFWLGASLTGASAQGLINFFNTSSTLVTTDPPSGGTVGPHLGSYLFALLTSPVGENNFTFAGVYGTNQAVAGRFSGGFGVAVNGWAPGTARDFEVVGWSSSEGTIFNPAWLTGDFATEGRFGISSVGTGVAGGATSIGTLPNLNIFGGATGIQSGFALLLVTPIPEPSGNALIGCGLAVLMVSRRRICRNHSAAAHLVRAHRPCRKFIQFLPG